MTWCRLQHTMADIIYISTFSASFLVLVLAFRKWFLLGGHIKPLYPPGPKPKYLVGNLFDIPTSSAPWMKYLLWAKQYGRLFHRLKTIIVSHPSLPGKIVHLDVLGQHIVVLNSLDAVNDLFEKRSRIYSDRPPFPFRLADLYARCLSHCFRSYGSTITGSGFSSTSRLCLTEISGESTDGYFTSTSDRVHRRRSNPCKWPRLMSYSSGS